MKRILSAKRATAAALFAVGALALGTVSAEASTTSLPRQAEPPWATSIAKTLKGCGASVWHIGHVYCADTNVNSGAGLINSSVGSAPTTGRVAGTRITWKSTSFAVPSQHSRIMGYAAVGLNGRLTCSDGILGQGASWFQGTTALRLVDDKTRRVVISQRYTGENLCGDSNPVANLSIDATAGTTDSHLGIKTTYNLNTKSHALKLALRGGFDTRVGGGVFIAPSKLRKGQRVHLELLGGEVHGAVCTGWVDVKNLSFHAGAPYFKVSFY